MLFLRIEGMAKVQIIMAATLDGFLPRKEEALMQWVRKDTRYGFPYWQEEATVLICPLYGVMDLMGAARRYDEECIYLATVHDEESAEYACGLFRYNLVDEIVLYLLPLSYGKGMPLTADFHFSRWRLRSCKPFHNGVCRLVYARDR